MTITIALGVAIEQDLTACEVSPITEIDQALSIIINLVQVGVPLTGHWGLKIN